MKRRRTAQCGFFNLRLSIAVLACVAAACSMVSGALLAFFSPETSSKLSQRTLTFAERVGYQRAIEDVYWRHRIWPKERPDPKPSLDEVMSAQQIEKKVEDYLSDSQALEAYQQKPIAPEQLQAEMERMARNTKQPKVLRELFAALGNDPLVIAECLARPVLAERLIAEPTVAAGVSPAPRSLFAADTHSASLRAGFTSTENRISATNLNTATYTLPEIDPCTDDTWTLTSITNAPVGRDHHTAIWTGSEMIIWGGWNGSSYFNAGGRYNPATDSWTATSTTNAPVARAWHTAAWTGSEMIVWGGVAGSTYFNTGGRYNPITDTWTATTNNNAPEARWVHTAVWTGTEMIVWGGGGADNFNTGGRYDPITDSWTATSTTNAPAGRGFHTAVWTGSEMIVWGGFGSTYLNTGGRYNPSTDSWVVTSLTNAPDARWVHTAVWTSIEMIIWGGFFRDNNGEHYLDTGGRYNPSTDSWTATSTTNAPAGRAFHTAVWTGSKMIVWGGLSYVSYLNTGGRYCAQGGPSPTPTPTATSTATATFTPTPTATATATPTATFTPTPTATATITPTATPTITITPRVTATPRVRPTPAPRP